MATTTHDPNMEQVASALKFARRRTRTTQLTLAERTGIAQADISRIEHCRGNPSLSTLGRLADGLGCRLILRFRDNETDEVFAEDKDAWL